MLCVLYNICPRICIRRQLQNVALVVRDLAENPSVVSCSLKQPCNEKQRISHKTWSTSTTVRNTSCTQLWKSELAILEEFLELSLSDRKPHNYSIIGYADHLYRGKVRTNDTQTHVSNRSHQCSHSVTDTKHSVSLNKSHTYVPTVPRLQHTIQAQRHEHDGTQSNAHI